MCLSFLCICVLSLPSHSFTFDHSSQPSLSQPPLCLPFIISTGSRTAQCFGGDGSCLNSFICKSLLVPLHLLLFYRKVNSSARWKKWAWPESSPLRNFSSTCSSHTFTSADQEDKFLTLDFFCVIYCNVNILIS